MSSDRRTGRSAVHALDDVGDVGLPMIVWSWVRDDTPLISLDGMDTGILTGISGKCSYGYNKIIIRLRPHIDSLVSLLSVGLNGSEATPRIFGFGICKRLF